MMRPTQLIMNVLLIGAVTMVLLDGRGSKAQYFAHSHEQNLICPSEQDIVEVYQSVAQELCVVDVGSNATCSISSQSSQTPALGKSDCQVTEVSSCGVVYQLCRQVILDLKMTSAECLNQSNNSTQVVSDLEAYGYGTLMVLLLCSLSLLGLLLVPLITSTHKLLYEYVFTFLIAMGTAGLFCDSFLHLLPAIFIPLHKASDEISTYETIFKSSAIIAGTLFFYLVELGIHYLSKKELGTHVTNHEEALSNSNDDCHQSSSHDGQEESVQSLLVPGLDIEKGSCENASLLNKEQGSNLPSSTNLEAKKMMCSFKEVRPYAWLILFGDVIHNFSDGIALAASISHGLTLAVSTMVAISLHEIPHEIADFAILVNCGMHWLSALFFNFLSSFSALLGFFFGMIISTNSEGTKEWLLAVATGSFLYIALTDLLPELTSNAHGHSHGSGSGGVINKGAWHSVSKFLLIMLGFLISFVVLFVLALFEDSLDSLLSKGKN